VAATRLRQEKSGDPWQLRFIASFYVTLPLNVLRGLKDDNVKRTMPIYKSVFILTTSRYATKYAEVIVCRRR